MTSLFQWSLPASLLLSPPTQWSLSQLMEVSSNILSDLLACFVPVEFFQDHSHLLSTKEWLLFICIPVYECFPPPVWWKWKKVVSGYRCSSTRTTSCLLFLITAGLCNRKWQFPVQWEMLYFWSLFYLFIYFFRVEWQDILSPWTLLYFAARNFIDELVSTRRKKFGMVEMT